MGLKRETAARFSFLLGMPAITLSGLVSTQGIVRTGFDSRVALVPLLGGTDSGGGVFLFGDLLAD